MAREIQTAVPPGRAARLERRLLQAAAAFDEDRPQDAARLLRPILQEGANVPSVRELAGLAAYRQGRWAEAARHLEAFRRLTGSVEQHPVLADSYRAQGRHQAVAELWEELRTVSPGAPAVTEGRIVAAGSCADRGDVRSAIRLLEGGLRRPKGRPAEHHLRLWYALADLYERAGDAPRARELFGRVVAADPSLADAAERLAALG